MNSKELEEILREFQELFLTAPDDECIAKYLAERDVYRACRDLITALEKYNRNFSKPVGLIERCVFCGQVIPNKKGV